MTVRVFPFGFLLPPHLVAFYNSMREFGFYRSPFLETSPD
jgi:hypothetical protein